MFNKVQRRVEGQERELGDWGWMQGCILETLTSQPVGGAQQQGTKQECKYRKRHHKATGWKSDTLAYWIVVVVVDVSREEYILYPGEQEEGCTAGGRVWTRWQGCTGVKMAAPSVGILHMVTRLQKDSAEI